MYSIAMTPRLSSCSRTGGAGADRLAAFRPSRGPQRPTRAARQVFAKAVATPTKEASTSASKSASISSETAKELYRDMVLGREFEEMCAQMYYRGKMFGFVHLYSGQEAVSTGVIKACLRKDDYISSTYRDHVHALSKGISARKIMSELFGKKTGTCRGQGGSMHMFDAEYGLLGGYAFIGEGIPVGLGAAFTSAYKRRVLGDDGADQVAVNFFGDGTCNVGQFYESLNMASLYKLPCIFVVENNRWAIGMNHLRATGSTLGDEEPWIHKKGPAFGMPGVHVDGMDVLAVREAALEAVARARRGEGPTLIEAETYRFRGHSLADPDELRSREEKEHYVARDPIPQLRAYMLKHGLASETDLAELHASVAAEVDDCVEYADASPKPDMSQLLENVFADPKGFGIAPDGRYRYELPGFTAGTAEVS
uniref:Pyruvate dehydrogenase E1 component subunit alpha n=2 Tax=Auxenochlorella protothecoides TaxID=3075 RepID=A0A1D2AFM8_AUXPR